MRENVKSVGLILAIAIASVSLPIGIMGFNKDAIINNYYTNNYYTTNNTTIVNIDNSTTIIGGDNETEAITYPLEIENYYNITTASGFFANNTLELYSNNIVIFTVNKTDNVDIELYLIQDSMYYFWLEAKDSTFTYDVWSFSNMYHKRVWNIPYHDIWYLEYRVLSNPYTVNITIMTEIMTE